MSAAVLWGNLALVFGASALWGAIALHALGAPQAAAWPPKHGTWPTALWAWGLTVLIYVGAYALGLAAWNPYGLPGWLTWGLGGALTLGGNLLHLKGMIDLGLAGTSGWDVGVSSKGSYGRLRHPQYLGQAIVFAGWAVLAANVPAALAALAAIAALGLVGQAEAKVLRVRHPARYDAYAAVTPGWWPNMR